MATRLSRLVVCAGIAAMLVPIAATADTGEWRIRAGASFIEPQADNGTLHLSRLDLADTRIDVADSRNLTFNVSYFVTSNIAVEVLAAYPLSNEFELQTIHVDGRVTPFAPALSFQYHNPIGRTFQPYVGVGVNYTVFSNAHVDAPVNVKLFNSIGLAYQVGFDLNLGARWLVNFDLRYINVSSNIDVDNVNVGNVDVNPFVYGVNFGYRF